MFTENPTLKTDSVMFLLDAAGQTFLIIRASFCCSKKMRKLHLFSTKVAIMRSKKMRKLRLFSTKVAFVRSKK